MNKRIVFLLAIGLAMMLMIAGQAFADYNATIDSSKGNTLAELPPAAQLAVSTAMGRDDGAYHATKFAEGYQLKGGHDLTAQFSGDGAVVSGWRLSLAGIGRGDELQTPSAAKPQMKANRVEYRRENITEWYVNGPLGLEQGFTLDQAPLAGNSGPLSLVLNLPDNMKTEIAKNRTDMTLTAKDNGLSISYGKLAAWDASGKSIPAWFELSKNGETHLLQIHVDDSKAQYPIIVDPMIVQQKLTDSGGAVGDQFGSSVAVSSDGNTALIGAYGKSSSTGAVYVFTRSSGMWIQQQVLTASDGVTWNWFGSSVAISGDGNTALIGAPYKNIGANTQQGAAYIFTRSSNTWSQQQMLTDIEGAWDGRFGSSVAISNDGVTALIGAVGKSIGANSYQGAAYVFTRSSNTWSQQRLTADDGAIYDQFGISVAISGDGATALVGTSIKSIGANYGQGAAYVYIRSGMTWSQQQRITAADGAFTDYFGSSVSLSSDGATALIGAVGKSIGANTYQGAAYVFTRSSNTWSQQQRMTAADGADGDQFGKAVSLASDGNTALIGASNKMVGANYQQGTAYIFTRSSNTWSQQQSLTAADGATNNYFGSSVALSGDSYTSLIGSYDPAAGGFMGGSYKGAAYVYAGDVRPCSAGQYDNGTACTPCAAGYFQPASRQTFCFPAFAGTSAPLPGALWPTACAAGSYQDQTGQTSCLSCAVGTYQPATGQASCFTIPKAATSIIIDPLTTPATIYAGIDTEGVYKSTDNTNWNPANGTNPNILLNLRVKALARSTGGIIYAATYGGGVFKTADSGDTWTACSTAVLNLNVVSLTIDGGGKIYAGTEAGVFVSSNNCTTWTAMNNGLPN